MSRFFDKHSLFRAPNETFSLVQSTQLSGKLSRLKNKHVRKNVCTSRLNANGSIEILYISFGNVIIVVSLIFDELLINFIFDLFPLFV